jgi:hypothetical protein
MPTADLVAHAVLLHNGQEQCSFQWSHCSGMSRLRERQFLASWCCPCIRTEANTLLLQHNLLLQLISNRDAILTIFVPTDRVSQYDFGDYVTTW